MTEEGRLRGPSAGERRRLHARDGFRGPPAVVLGGLATGLPKRAHGRPLHTPSRSIAASSSAEPPARSDEYLDLPRRAAPTHTSAATGRIALFSLRGRTRVC